MARIKVLHRTVYRYAEAVHFSEHRFMCRPRDSHDLRLIETGIRIDPLPEMRWLHDVFGNSVLIARFTEPAPELSFESTFLAEHYPSVPEVDLIEPYAMRLPFSYDAGEMPDLARSVERQYPDSRHRVDAWVREICARAETDDTLSLIKAVTHGIKDGFEYRARDEEGTQSPVQTLELGSGSCRDFALLMIEAVRSLGLAARFVSGYLYDESLVDAENAMVGGGATHAWVHVYLPGAGWLPFDPTNGIVGGRNLIRVAVARDPAQAAPLTGSYVGPPDAYLGMEVEVKVSVG
ncbi:MAG: transglutaminase family protein [Rhodocyclaceae bacterium]|nr:transglutaminase family protein [Rhodocyclaceae bacterium]